MKKRIKRLFSFTMATVLVALSLSTSVLAASEDVSVESNDLGYSMDYDMDNIKVINQTTGEVYDYNDTSSEEGFDLDSCFTDVTNEDVTDAEAERLKEFFSALDNDELDVIDVSAEESQSHIETYSLESGKEVKIWVIEYGSAKTLKDYDFSYVDGRLKLSKNGYYSIDVNASEVGMADALNQTINTVKLTLVPKKTESNIAAVYCNGKDVLAEKVSIDDSKRGTTNVYVVAADGTDRNADIAITSNGKDPMSGDLVDSKMNADKNYAVLSIEPQYLPQNAKNNGFCFRIYNDKEDNKTVDRDSVTSNLMVGKGKPTFAVGFDSDLSFTIPKSVPVIGGGDISLELAKLPLYVKVESNKVRVGINTKQSYVDSGDGWNEYKRWLEDTAKNKKAAEDSIQKFLDKEKTPFKAGFKGAFNLQIGGMIEIDWDEVKEVPTRVGGCLLFSTDVAVNGEWQVFIVVVPVVIKLSVSVGFNALVQVGYDIEHSKAYINGQLTFILPKIRLSGGIGCAKVADVSLYGQGANKVDFDISESRGIVMAGLEGEAGVSVKVLFFKYSKALWKGRWQYYRGTGKDKADSDDIVTYYPEDEIEYISLEEAQTAAADLDNFEIDRSYINEQSEWLPEEENKDALGAPVSNIVSNSVTLQKSVFFSASPQIIASENGTKLLVWTSDIKDRDTGDHTAVVYSVYDDINNVWKEPEIIEDDGTLDSNPQAIAVGDKIYIAWMDSSEKDYGYEASPEDIAANMDITVAEFDTWTKSVTKVMDTGSGDGLEMYPHLIAHDGKAHLVWVTNTSDDFYGAGKNIVKYVDLSSTDDNTILGTEVFSTENTIEDIAAGEIGSKLCVSYILGDADTSQNENHAHGVRVKSISGNDIDNTVSENAVSKPKLKMSKVNDKSILTWCAEGKLYYSEDGVTYGTMDSASDISPDYVIINRNGKDVLFCTNSSEKETDIFYHEMDGYSIKKPVQISDADGYVTSFSAAKTADSVEVAYSKTTSTITNEGVYEKRDICIKSIPSEGYNETEIEDCYHDEKQVKSGATVPFIITVKNNGLLNQDCVKYTVFKEDAEKISREYIVGDLNNLQTTYLSIPVGETATFTIDVPVGEIDGKSTIGVMVEADNDEHNNPHFDEFESVIGYADLELSVESVNSNSNYAVNAIVSNVGAVDTKAYLNIIEGGTDGEILKTCYLGDIKAGETKEYEISSDVLNSINFNQETVTFEAVSTVEEFYLLNNTDFIHKYIDGLVVRFNANGGECKTDSKTIAPGGKYGSLPQASRKGYKFLGWYAGDTKITSDTEFTADSARELLAKWEVNEYTVYFDTGYNLNVEPIKVKYDAPYGTLPNPVLPGATFEGWYFREENETEGLVNYEITPETIVSIADNHTLYAQVKPKNKALKPVFYDGDTGNVLTGNVVLKKGTSVKIKTDTRGATLYYTVDRSDPNPVFLGGDSDEGTHVYEDEIVVSKNEKIMVIAAKQGYENSPVATLNVTVDEDWGDIDNPQAFNNDISKVPEGLWISGIESKVYTGKAIKQDIKVYCHTTLLKENQDYTVSYKNNVNVGNALITVTGKRGCSGKVSEAFSIGRANISTSRLIADDIILAYNGKVQKGKTSVKYKFDDRIVTLKEGKDFIFDYSAGTTGHNPERAYLEDGDYRVVICGIGNYDGLGYFNEKITKSNFISKAKVSNIKTLNYDGTAKEQQNIEVKYAGKKLVAGEDYKVSYENNIMAGTATVVITGINKFVGTKKVNFTIKGTDIKKTDIIISNISSYTGDEIEPTVYIINKNSVSANLVEGVDYTISYSNNVKASKRAKIIIKGLKGYTGTVNKTFVIKPYEMKAVSGNRVLAHAATSVKYIKGGTKPLPVLSDGSYELVNGKDYRIKYKNYANVHNGTDAKAPVMEVSGIGNYSGKLIFNYAIEKKSISDNEISISVKDVIYKNKAGIYKSKVTVKDVNGRTLSAGKDYKNIVYSYAEDTIVNQKEGRNDYKQYVRKAGEKIDSKDIIPVGAEIEVAISGDGNYTGVAHADFRLIAADISKAKISIEPQYYTGKAVHISRKDIKSIKIGKDELRREDFEIVGYKNNVNPGKATVIIRGKGGLGGEKVVTFIIKPKAVK